MIDKQNLKWIIPAIGCLILLILLVFSSQGNVMVPPLSCEQQGYVPVDTANQLVGIANQVINLTNICFSNQNLTALPYIARFKDMRTNSS